MMRSRVAKTTAALCASAAITACAAFHKQAPPAAAPLPSGTVAENVVSATAKVKAIDVKSRRVTLERADGSVTKFVVSDQVRSLDQASVGDNVNVTYYESLTYEAKRAGDTAPGASLVESVGRPKLGQKPGEAHMQVDIVTATIAGIDKAANRVTLRGADGELTTVTARNPEDLDEVTVGDLVDITYTKVLAISVDTPASE